MKFLLPKARIPRCGFVVLLVAVAVSYAAEAAEWHVNNRAANASDSNPGTAEEPFLTINAATTNVNFEAGDTVYVHPGIYNTGKVPTSEGPNWASRVYLPKKTYLLGTGRVDETIIKGVRSSAAGGLGDSTVRCITIGGAGSVVSNLTICGGGTKSKDGGTGSGGGVSASSTGSYIVDCVISNCAATKGGGTYSGTAVRCRYINNIALGSTSGNCGAAAGYSYLFNCVIENCNGTRSEGNLVAALSECRAVNCTVFNCRTGVSTGRAYNCVFSVLYKDVSGSGTLLNCSKTSVNGYYQLVGPGVGDYRLIAGSGGDSIACSATEFSSLLSLPAEYATIDYAGNPFPSSGTCLPGAVQGTATVKGGAIQASSDNLVVEGKRMLTGEWVFAEAWPTQFHVSASVPAGQHLWAFHRAVAAGGRMYPQMDDTIWFMPSPETANVVTVQPYFATHAYYVNPDPEIGSNSNDGLTAETPFLTLQKAMGKCNTKERSVIYAAEGDYNQGGGTIASNQSNGWTLTNRVCASGAGFYVRLKGAGVGRSFITGAPDPNTGGAGPGAVRPIGSFCHDMCVQGFTIRDGWSHKSSSYDQNFVAAVQGRTLEWTATGNALTITDCLITNCTSAAGGTLVGNAILERCRVMGNTSDPSVIAYNNRISSCLVSGNTVGSSGATMGSCTMANSTIIGSDGKILIGSTASAYASIIERGTSLYAGNRLYGTLAWDVAAGAAGGDWLFGAPCFADPSSGDYRLLSMSPARSAGAAPSAENWGTNWWKMASTGDVDGNRLLFEGGRNQPGAMQGVVEASGIYVANRRGGLSVPDGYHAISGGESLTVGIAPGTRPVIGFVVDGVTTNLFDEMTGPIEVAAGDSSRIEAMYTSDWYVDAVNGSDDDCGFTPGTAKKTFKEMFGTGLVVAGDTVHAAEGTYSNGVTVATGEMVGSRVFVPANVTVVADGAAERTIILGAAANPGANTYGLGTNAVRCVSLGSGSVIRGFTLTGGRTGKSAGPNGEDVKEYKENIGGGVYGRGKSSGTVECCIISNNIAYRGGGASYTALRKCRVYGNFGTDTSGNGSAQYRGSAVGTLFKGNTGKYGVMYVGSLTGCTVIHGGSSSDLGVYATSSCTLRNCILRCLCLMKTTTSIAYNSYFDRRPTDESTYHNIDTNTSKVVTADRLQLDDDGRPIVGANDAIDMANPSYYDAATLGDTDASGFQRVMNGALDCGALEADWRPKYTGDIGRNHRAFAVKSATPGVVETTNSTVMVLSGQVLEATWANTTGKALPHEVAFRVTGNGELALTVNGETARYTADDGDVVYNFLSAAPSATLAFAYTGGEDDEGGAELLYAKRYVGTLIMVR